MMGFMQSGEPREAPKNRVTSSSSIVKWGLIEDEAGGDEGKKRGGASPPLVV